MFASYTWVAGVEAELLIVSRQGGLENVILSMFHRVSIQGQDKDFLASPEQPGEIKERDKEGSHVRIMH